MSSFLALAIILLLFSDFRVSCQTAGDVEGYFISPPGSGPAGDYTGNPIFPVTSVLTIQWESYLDDYKLQLWQQNLTQESASSSSNALFTHVTGDRTSSSILWPVQLYEFNLQFSNVFYFSIGHGAPQGGFNSHYFNITTDFTLLSSTAESRNTDTATSAPGSAVVTGAARSTSSSSLFSSASSSSPSSASSSSSSEESTAQPSSAALSSGHDDILKIALGVGVGVGVPILLLLGVIVGMRLIKTRRGSTASDRSDNKNFLPSGSDERNSYAMKSPSKPHAEQPPVYYEASEQNYGPFEVSGSPRDRSGDHVN